jgi:hypothetical protein
MTESQRKNIRPLTSHEERVIEALHFVTSFQDLSRETKFSSEVLSVLLETLLRDGLVQAFIWSDTENEFVTVETTPKPLTAHSFLATKDGLFSFHAA